VRRLIDDWLEPGAARVLLVATLVSTIGNGLFVTSAVLFFTRSAGLPVGQVGLGLTIAGLVGLLGSVALGRVADRYETRTTLIVLSTLEGLAMCSYVAVHSFALFLAAVVAVTVLDDGTRGVRQALLSDVETVENRRIRLRARLQVVTNFGFALGTAGAGVALAVDTRTAYVAVALGNAASFLACAAVLTRLPPTQHIAPAATRGWAAIRDRPYVGVTALNGVMCLLYGVAEVAMPLWVARQTRAPLWIVAALFALTCVCVVLFQVRASRGVEHPRTAAHATRTAGWLLFAACILFALAHDRPPALAVAILVAASLAHVAAELLVAAASWSLGWALAPPARNAEYQGVFATGRSLANTLAPVALTALLITWGWPGWIVLAAIFALAGTLTPAAVRWAATPHNLPLALDPTFEEA
jgi:hypothetical protein